jgi:hypothetical protein
MSKMLDALCVLDLEPASKVAICAAAAIGELACHINTACSATKIFDLFYSAFSKPITLRIWATRNVKGHVVSAFAPDVILTYPFKLDSPISVVLPDDYLDLEPGFFGGVWSYDFAVSWDDGWQCGENWSISTSGIRIFYAAGAPPPYWQPPASTSANVCVGCSSLKTATDGLWWRFGTYSDTLIWVGDVRVEITCSAMPGHAGYGFFHSDYGIGTAQVMGNVVTLNHDDPFSPGIHLRAVFTKIR